MLLRATTVDDLQIHGENVKVRQVPMTACLQVICSAIRDGPVIEEDTLEAYFSNSRFTGVKDSSSYQSAKYLTDHNHLPVYVVKFSNPKGLSQSYIETYA